MLFTIKDIQQFTTPASYDRGLAYQRSGHVLSCHIAQAGNLITGIIQGGETAPYNVVVQIQPNRKHAVTINGHCDCPMQFNCKHVVALLLHALQENTELSLKPTTPRPATDTLTPAVDTWLEQLTQTIQPSIAAAPVAPRMEFLHYVLNVDTRLPRPQLYVEFFTLRIKKDGRPGKPQVFRGGLNSTTISEDDRFLLRWLQALKDFQTLRATILGKEGARLLHDMIATGRCHWQSATHPPLLPGAIRSAGLQWVLQADGSQQLRCQGDGIDILLPLEPPWYIDTTQHQCGQIDLNVPDHIAKLLVHAPLVAPQQAAAVRKQLGKLAGPLPIPLPRQFEDITQRPVKPVPHLTLLVKNLQVRYEYRWEFDQREVAIELAQLRFNYDDTLIGLNDPRNEICRVAGNSITYTQRDLKTEHQALQALDEWGFEPIEMAMAFEVPEENIMDLSMCFDEQRTQALVNFTVAGIPQLQAQGWKIHLTADYPFRSATQTGEWYVSVDTPAAHPWFDIDLGIEVDGQAVSLLPILDSMLAGLPELKTLMHSGKPQAYQTVATRLPDGRLLSLPLERLYTILSTLEELHQPHSNTSSALRLNQYQLAQLAELEDALGQNTQWHGGERQRTLGRQLKAFDGIKAVSIPNNLQATLRPYQQLGLNWLQFLREYQLAGILADDMGLGKTIQALAHLLCEKNSGRMDLPSLVVAPTSLMYNWRAEAERFAPELRVLVLQGSERKQHFNALRDYDLILTTYPLLPRDQDVLLAQRYHLMILDEAQNIKNPTAKASQLVRQLQARHLLCLTGTPLENHLGELWAQFDFLMPGLLGNDKEFRRLFRTPIEKHNDKPRLARLVRRVSAFMLRRTKQEVATELPPKTEIIQTIELSGAQRDLYESIRLAMHEKVRDAIRAQGISRSHIIILDALLKLRQVCCDPRLLKLSNAKNLRHSAKLDWLMDALPELIAEGRRILLFSQFTSMLALIEDALSKQQLDYVKLTGDTKQRATPIQRFQAGKVPLFLISLKAGGTGLNLTAADTVIHYDPWWNPAVENQATDRAHRIGQDKPVFVYKLITSGTVEEKILQMQARKQALADSLFSAGGEAGKALSADDLEALFEPLG
ncbi:MAG: DEAD/DEAH box helicase [Gammaproteobacteria bacterium]|nr:DEAD/DEAH box helicase [Gammaproteobacteria bacterium]